MKKLRMIHVTRSLRSFARVATLLLLTVLAGEGNASAETATAPTHAAGDKFIPLPVYATLPNEGNTYGFMGVLLDVNPETERTEAIYAPSISWNGVIKTTGTFRYYKYPSDTQSLTFIASASTYVNWGTVLLYNNDPLEVGQLTDDVFFRVQRSVFFRFFGIGPDTGSLSETSHTRLRGDVYYRKGINVAPHLNIGAQVELARDILQRYTVPNIPLSQDVFADAPGLGGATVSTETIDIRYDTRPRGQYSPNGVDIDLGLSAAQGIAGSPDFQKARFESTALIPENDGMQGGARVFWSYVSSSGVPFFYQNHLGGSYYLRGFTEDRFTDQGAWLVEFEQRIRLFQTHIYGVTTDWRVDPFAGVGQVYHDGAAIFAHPRPVGGLGFRAFVHPNVLGRVDMGYGGEGFEFYVEIGYPF